MNKLPSWLVAAIAIVVTALLVYNILADVIVDGYQGQGVTLMLGGLVGGLLGIHKFMRGGGGDP